LLPKGRILEFKAAQAREAINTKTLLHNIKKIPLDISDIEKL
jgi:hypothetical protein